MTLGTCGHYRTRSVIPAHAPIVIPDIFNRESRAIAFSFFLDAGSGSGMTVRDAWAKPA